MTIRHSAKVWNEIHRGLLESLRQATEKSGPDDGGTATGPAVSEVVGRLCELTAANRHYLARSFTEQEKYDCAHFHYSWLLDKLGAARVSALIAKGVEIWRQERESVWYSADIRFEYWVAREGELTLEMYAHQTIICLLSFSVAPGRLFGFEAREAILISRLQGNPGQFEQVRAATRAMSEVSPKAALFAVLAGVAKAVGIDIVVGVAAANHVSFLPDKRELLERQYDDFFRGLDGTPLAGGFYVIDLSAPAKPLTLQKTGHRVRTKKKRLLKQQISEAVAQSCALILPPPDAALTATGSKPNLESV